MSISYCAGATAFHFWSRSGSSSSITITPLVTLASGRLSVHSRGRGEAALEELFKDPDTFVVLAMRETTAVGYAMCHLRRGADDTWDTGNLIGEVETLVVAPTERGTLGTALMDAAEAQFAQLGANDVMAAVMEGNDRAMEFYRRRGMTPTVTYVMRVRDTGDEAASGT